MQSLEEAELDDLRLQQGCRCGCPSSGSTGPTSTSAASAAWLAGGTLRQGQRVRVQPSGARARVARIVASTGDRPQAVAGESVTITLADEVDISRGDVISAADARPRWPTSSSARWCGWPTSRCCRAGPTC
jgi:bifunctional enzyme CysN/CysC